MDSDNENSKIELTKAEEEALNRGLQVSEVEFLKFISLLVLSVITQEENFFYLIIS